MVTAQLETASRTASYGLVAEFDTPEALVEAALSARSAGYTRMDAYTPFPVHGLAEALKFDDPRVPWVVFLGGVAGAIAGLGLQVYTSVIDYPQNVGGRPFLSLPAFFPVTFECTVLFAAFGAVFGMLAMNGLPQPYHPIFNAPGIERASQDGFFLCIEASDPAFDHVGAADFLRSVGAVGISAVDL